MKSWYWLVPRDQRHNNFIFWQEGPPKSVRDIYRDLQCPECQRVDERGAILLPTDPAIRIRASSDIVGTSDGMLCFSGKAKALIEHHRFHGLAFFPFTGDDRYYLVWPTRWVDVILSEAGFQYENAGVVCSLCNRPIGGAFVGPLKTSFLLPDDEDAVVAPTVWREDRYSRQVWLLVSDKFRRIIKAEKITGVEFVKPL